MKDMDPIIRFFPGDPDDIRTLQDIEAIERIPVDERFPFRSTRDAVMVAAQRYPDEIALSFLPNGSAKDNPQQWTYKQYLSEVIAAANMFHELGLTDAESVCIILPNLPEMLFAIWGAEMVGIASPINPFLRPEQMAGIAREADARILVTLAPQISSEVWEKARQVRELVPGIRHVITIGGAAEGSLEWKAVIASQDRHALRFDRMLTGDETASYFHTGGTTGTPKLARRTHRGEVVNVCQMIMIGPGAKDYGMDRRVILCGLPLFHAGAYISGGLNAIIQGAELVLAGPSGFRNRTLVEDFWSLVERYRVTLFVVVPTVYAALLNQSSHGHDLSSLRLGGSGGAPLSVNLLREFRNRTGADIIEGYGMTESTASATSHTYRGGRKLGSVGMRLPYLKVRIVEFDKQGAIRRDCGIDEIGTILLSGPNVIPGYKQESANKKAWPEPGWFNTGDMGRCDSDGYYWITGRAKDLIIRGGHNIDPVITEDSLTSHPEVVAAAAVGRPDSYAGELPIAYVELIPGAAVTAQELVQYAREHSTERAAAPVEVIIVDALPLTAVGKVFKPDLRKDAIARAYSRIIEDTLGDTQIQVSVEADPVHGVKVILRPRAGINVERTRQNIAAKLNSLTYVWEIQE